jgi:hypothetical protein
MHLLTSRKYWHHLNPRTIVAKCKEWVKNDFSVVTIEMAKPYMSIARRDITVSVGEKVALLGMKTVFQVLN